MTTKSEDILKRVNHRPYPLPVGPWVMRQTWNRLLFAHWPVEPSKLRPHLPSGVELDTYEGQSYVGILPFRMTGVRVRALPPIPGTMSMLQINVRTYVRRDDRPGVFFLSLDTNNIPTVLMTHLTLGLPYRYANMEFGSRLVSGQREFTLRSQIQRLSNGNEHHHSHGRLDVTYKPASEPFRAVPGSLEHWLTERYCLYSTHLGKLLRVDIHHHPWTLQKAIAEFREQSLLPDFLQPSLPASTGGPLLHYAHQMDALIWLPRFL